MNKTSKAHPPPLWLSLTPIIVTGLALGLSVFLFKSEPHFALFLGAAVAGGCAYWHGMSWKSIREGFKRSIGRTLPSLIILLIIGMLIAVWIASGIVPVLMYLGFELLVARWFLPLILMFCCLMALVTGSSWSTIGTIGVAAIGVSEGLGIPMAVTAGAVVSGSFFGDKLSPMSDSTNLTPSVLGVNLYDHIRHMLYTTLIGLLLSLVLFTILGLTMTGGGQTSDVSSYSETIRNSFNLSPLLAIPPLMVITLIVKKVPAIPSLIAGLILGMLAYLFLQEGSLSDLLQAIHSGFEIETGNKEVDGFFSRGGMESMYGIISLAIFSLALGGIMNDSGMLHRIVLSVSGLLKTAGRLTAVVTGTSVLVNLIGANQYLAVILPGQMYEECYRSQKLSLKNLTRTLEAGGTMVAPLIPWNSSGVFVFSVLGVSAMAYAPYAILCWITPLIVIVYGFFDINMKQMTATEARGDHQ